MTSVLAIMAVCVPASTIDFNSAPMRLPVPYTQDCECQCGNSGRIGGVWLNYYSPCRCGGTTIMLAEPFPLPPLREDPLDTQLHPILHPSVYAPSLNPGYFGGLHHSVFAPLLIQPYELDHHMGHQDLMPPGVSFDIDVARFSDMHSMSTTVPEPATLALLAVGVAVVARRRKRSAA